MTCPPTATRRPGGTPEAPTTLGSAIVRARTGDVI